VGPRTDCGRLRDPCLHRPAQTSTDPARQTRVRPAYPSVCAASRLLDANVRRSGRRSGRARADGQPASAWAEFGRTWPMSPQEPGPRGRARTVTCQTLARTEIQIQAEPHRNPLGSRWRVEAMRTISHIFHGRGSCQGDVCMVIAQPRSLDWSTMLELEGERTRSRPWAQASRLHPPIASSLTPRDAKSVHAKTGPNRTGPSCGRSNIPGPWVSRGCSSSHHRLAKAYSYRRSHPSRETVP
jgi:hypothetical protein